MVIFGVLISHCRTRVYRKHSYVEIDVSLNSISNKNCVCCWVAERGMNWRKMRRTFLFLHDYDLSVDILSKLSTRVHQVVSIAQSLTVTGGKGVSPSRYGDCISVHEKQHCSTDTKKISEIAKFEYLNTLWRITCIVLCSIYINIIYEYDHQ